MHIVDYIVFVIYMGAVLGVGYYYFRKNTNSEDYYVGSRSMSAPHVGLSIAATDVGGGFSIGLGGLGFAMGLSGTWLLFTGLVGAWLSAVFIIPRIKKIDSKMFTYPDFLRSRYDEKTAILMDEPVSSIDTGKTGEDYAVRYLENEGFTVIERNYHITEGEIDIIVQKEELIAFVEVKFSQTGAFGEPETWVTPKKQEKIIKAARSFLASRDISGPEIRFDVIAVRAENNDLYIRHIPAAFIMETTDE